MNRRDALRHFLIGATSVVAGSASTKWQAHLVRDSASRTLALLTSQSPLKGPMLTKQIPRTGEAIPVIGMGTWQTFDVGTSAGERKPLEEVLAEFSRAGGKLIDSSPMYGNSEQVVGELSAKLGLRQKLFIATKVWTQGRDAGIRQMEESLRKLLAEPPADRPLPLGEGGVRARSIAGGQSGPIDLMQVHTWSTSILT